MFKTKKCINTLFINRGLNNFKNILQLSSNGTINTNTNLNTISNFKLTYLINQKFSLLNLSKINSNNSSNHLINSETSDLLSKNEEKNLLNKETLIHKKTTKKEKVVKEKETKVKTDIEKDEDKENEINKNKNKNDKKSNLKEIKSSDKVDENKGGEKLGNKKTTKKIKDENEPCNLIYFIFYKFIL